MTIQGINVEQALENARKAIDQDTSLSASTRAVFEVLIMLITALLGRTQRNSRNSHTPPSADPNRPKSSRSVSHKPRGGQPGHVGSTLEPVDAPDEIQSLLIDRRTLARGHYTSQGFEKRQVMDIEVLRWVTEYQAEVLVDEHGQRFVAEFPAGVTRPIQYGPNLKAHAVYLSQYQLLPYERIREYLVDQLGVPLSAGSLVRFNEQAVEAPIITSPPVRPVFEPTTYIYDEVGNPLTQTDANSHTTTWTYNTYSYNGKNELVGTTVDGLTTTYTYNPNGIRTSQTQAGSTTDFIVDENRDYAQVLAELVGGQPEITYTYQVIPGHPP